MANVCILYPLKTPEDQMFFDVFRGCKKGTLPRNGLRFVFSLRYYWPLSLVFLYLTDVCGKRLSFHGKLKEKEKNKFFKNLILSHYVGWFYFLLI